MNDRFLFRGNRLDGQGWVQGLLINEGRMIQCKQEMMSAPLRLGRNKYGIDPDTIRQCFGFKDKNGNLAFDKDYFTHDDTHILRQLYFCEDRIRWRVETTWEGRKGSDRFDLDSEWWSYHKHEIELIDNPELL